MKRVIAVKETDDATQPKKRKCSGIENGNRMGGSVSRDGRLRRLGRVSCNTLNTFTLSQNDEPQNFETVFSVNKASKV